jgi:host factor-I protein
VIAGVPMSDITIQESFFAAALQGGKHITVYLLNGAKVTGRVRSFDKYSLVMENDEAEQLVFKHSISAAFVCRDKKCPQCLPVKRESANSRAAMAS